VGKKEFPDTFGHGPSLKGILLSPLLFSKTKGCMGLYGNLAGGLRNWDSTPFYQVQLLESTTYLCYAPSALSYFVRVTGRLKDNHAKLLELVSRAYQNKI